MFCWLVGFGSTSIEQCCYVKLCPLLEGKKNCNAIILRNHPQKSLPKLGFVYNFIQILPLYIYKILPGLAIATLYFPLPHTNFLIAIQHGRLCLWTRCST